MRFFLFILLSYLSIFAEEFQATPANSEIYRHVNVITGHLSVGFDDGSVKGPIPIPLKRYYSSNGALLRANQDVSSIIFNELGPINGGWTFFPQIHLFIMAYTNLKETKIYCREPSGTMVEYHYERKEGKYKFLLKARGEYPLIDGEISAAHSPRENKMIVDYRKGTATIHLPSGGKRVYHGKITKDRYKNDYSIVVYKLREEVLPSGHKITYHYRKDRYLEKVISRSPTEDKAFAELVFHYTPNGIWLKTSDKKSYGFHFIKYEDRKYLSGIKKDKLFTEKYDYHPARKKTGARIQGFSLSDEKTMDVEYYLPTNPQEERRLVKHPNEKNILIDKVKKVILSQGKEFAEFTYEPGKTIVKDEKNRIIHFYHAHNKLTQIDTFDSSHNLYASERFYWDIDKLVCRALFDSKGNAIHAKTFIYDKKGNVTEEKLWGTITGQGSKLEIAQNGNILSGESYGRYYQYAPRINLPILEKEDNGMTTHYQYKPNTNLLTKKFICDQDRILIRKSLQYNADHFLIAEIEDDGSSFDLSSLQGVTQRRIKRYLRNYHGYVVETQESYWDPITGKEQPVKFVQYSFNDKKQVTSEAVYNGLREHLYTLHTTYDSKGRKESYTDPLGRVFITQYDKQGKLIYTKDEKAGVEKEYTYDPYGRKSAVNTHYFTGGTEIDTFAYENSDFTIVHTDNFGNITREHLDDFDRTIHSELPSIIDSQNLVCHPSFYYKRDITDNIVSATTNGLSTCTTYNVFRKPLFITYPDDTKICYEYNLDGTLAKTIYSDGSYHLFEYDIFQRIRSKKLYSITSEVVAEESWEYSPFACTSYTDHNGETTYFQYDGLNRKIKEISNTRTISYTYDDSGYLRSVYDDATQVSHYTVRDVTGRVVEEWDEFQGNKEKHKSYTYDDQDNLLLCKSDDSLDQFVYDHKKRIIRYEDPLGNVSKWIYNDGLFNGEQTIKSKIQIDSQGNITEEWRNSLGQLISIFKRSPTQIILSREDFFYDRQGNQIKRESSVYEAGMESKKITVQWEYDLRGRIIKQIEPMGKTICYTYDCKGRKSSTKKPDGTIFYYTYDTRDRLIEKRSSDESIHYQYFYESSDLPIKIVDLNSSFFTERVLDSRGNLLQETNALGHIYSWEYDDADRCSLLTLPDQSSIAYKYIGQHMTMVKRDSPLLSYSHIYEEFDSKGHVIQEKTINEKLVTTSYDLMERPIFQSHPFGNLSASYDEVGLLCEKESYLCPKKTYKYDSLQQITQENEISYSFDSMGNPYGPNILVNSLNQLEQRDNRKFEYDLNGNLISKTDGTEIIHYHYDALDRLIAIEEPNNRIEYFYDGLDRLVQKKSFSLTNGIWLEEATTEFLYDKSREIGSISNGKIRELKVLGLGYLDEIGATIAIEINGEVYAPVHDLKGNITAIASQTKIIEKYNYNAFGFETSNSGINPWRFSSKRHDNGLIYFGFRFYEPSMERWLTPDPAGFVDSSNLYSYVLNDPVNRLDLYGLIGEDPFHDMRSVLDTMESQIYDMNTSIYLKYLAIVGCPNTEVFVIGNGEVIAIQFNMAHVQAGKDLLIKTLYDNIPSKSKDVNILINGINVSRGEFQYYCEDLYKSHKDPVIGLYNESIGLRGDYTRATYEKKGGYTKAIWQATEFLLLTTDNLDKINPDCSIKCIVHSEGGLVYKRAYDHMDPGGQELINNKLNVIALGPYGLIPKSYGKSVVNIYSDQDYVTKPKNIEEMLKHPDYNISVVPCIAQGSDKTVYVADHNYLSPTYVKARKDTIYQIKQLEKTHEITR